MGFRLEANGATAPNWPHISCFDGWAWHDKPDQLGCFSGEKVAAPAQLVAEAIDGRTLPGIDRILAVERLHQKIHAGIFRVFQKECSACGSNHQERAKRLLRAVKVIHPTVIDLLREARVPESLLCQPRFRKHGEPRSEARKGVRATLPVWPGDPGKTHLAQAAFAIRYASMCGIAIAVEKPVAVDRDGEMPE